ncbi:MAG: bifunctional oligoribonuclease/PAP phosphatase NrnA [Defluviitaleaceae bacterium]|nr:bifunctional oligoribonuclease/PAP phosphatase NrnA [Defluviitaleaceae bacterium]
MFARNPQYCKEVINLQELEMKLQEAINTSSTIAIAGHVNPDGDAIGACFALAAYLDGLGKNVAVLLESCDPKYDIIPGKQYLYQGNYDKLTPDLFIALDASTPDRLGKAEAVMHRAKTTAMFDHHMNNTIAADIRFVDPNAPSTTLMLYNHISKHTTIDTEIAAAIYAGLVYDTGGFRHSSTTPESLEVAAKLMRTGFNFTRVYAAILHEKSRDKTRLYAEAIARIAYAEPGIAYTYITLEDKAKYEGEYPNGVIDYLATIRGVSTAICATEQDDHVRVSMRSSRANVGELAASLGGGGHKAAAGFSAKGDPLQIINDILPKLQTELKSQ